VQDRHTKRGLEEHSSKPLNIRAYGIDRFLGELQQELISETYKANDVRRVLIQKQDGKERSLGIPTIKDRIVQQAVKSIKIPKK
jgi:retron-type reverse transcriptase